MNSFEAYQHQLNRLTEEQKYQLNLREQKIGRSLFPFEIVEIFHLEPSGKQEPRRRRMSDEVEADSSWMNQ